MTQPDNLIDSYKAAQKLQQNLGPSEQTRNRILAHAAQLANGNPSKDVVIPSKNTTDLIAKKSINTAPANDSQWKIRALASVAVFGIAGLMMLQFRKEAPEEFLPTAKPPVSAGRSAEPVTNTENETKSAADKSLQNSASASASSPAVPAVTQPKSSLTPSQKPQSTPLSEQSAKKSDSTSREDIAAAVPTELKQSKQPHESRAEASTDKTAEVASSLAQAPRAMTPAAAASAPASPAPSAATAAMADSAKLSRSAAIAPPVNKNANTNLNSKLFNAIQTKDSAALKLALDSGDDKNAKNADGTPALSLCVQSEQLNLVRLLIAAGADVNALDTLGVSPLVHARNRGFTDIVNLLLNSGAK